jgi:O-Antigen ligase/Tetratricopeptide repeat
MSATTAARRLVLLRGGGAAPRAWLLSPAVALGVVGLALDEGASGVTSRSVAAIVVWWAVLLTVAFSLFPRAPMPRLAPVAGGALAAFTLLTGASALWAPSAERAFLDFGRLGLYLGLFALAVLATRPGDARRWADGLALGIAVVGCLALAQRLLPGLLPATDIPRLLPSAGNRLSYPIGYWNGLAVMLALGLPLLARAAIAAETLLARAAAVVPIPIIVAAMYLTSSRGGMMAAAVALLAFLALTPRRFAAFQALGAAAVASAIAIVVLADRPALVDGTPGGPAAEAQGPDAAVPILLVSLLAGAVYAALTALAPRQLRLPRVAVVALAAVVVAGAGAAAAATDPAERFRSFKQPPAPSADGGDFVRSHLLSSAGSGRWQYWSAAFDQFEAHPVVGQGAGSFEAWWAQHGTIDWFIRNAHSLWLETLGELGLIGLLLLLAVFTAGAAGAVERVRGARGTERTVPAALAGVLAGFVAGASIDWTWHVPAVAAVAVVALALLVGPGTAAALGSAPVRTRFALRVSLVLAAWLAILAQAIPYLMDNELAASQRAAARGDLVRAQERAASARVIQPWASSPYLQLALVHEEAGDVQGARRYAQEAIARDRADWRLRLVAARLAVKAGDVAAARGALREARRLNPRSPALRTTGRG